MLGKQARVSDFWSEHGGNPILHHHAYLPGTHLLMLPAYLALRGAGLFDPRLVTLIAYAAAALLAARLVEGPERRLSAAALVAVNPLVYWQQAFGANDLVPAALLLAALLLGVRGRPLAAGAVLGLACATKQLAWPFAPFLLAHLSGARSLRELVARPALVRILRPAAVALAVFMAVVAPVAALDPRAFWADIVVYNVGLPGGDNYPLGGTPGFGFANMLLYLGRVASLRDHVDFGRFYLLLAPLGLLLLRQQLREGHAARALTAGSAALLLSIYFSRVVHPNYLILAAVLLPLGFLMGERRAADVAVVPLMLLAVAVEVAEGAILRTTWEDVVAARLADPLPGLPAALAPRAGPALTLDPLGLALSAIAAGLGIAYLTVGLMGAGPRVRRALLAAAVVLVAAGPTVTVTRIGLATGVPRMQQAWSSRITENAAEAWSQSFRKDPPPARRPDGTSPAILDWRWLTLMGYAAAIPLLALLVPPALRLAALGGALLNPCAVVGLVFGSAAPVVLSGTCAVFTRWRTVTAAVVAALVSVAWVIVSGTSTPHLLAVPIACLATAVAAEPADYT
jgi:hypothetical protein